MKTRWQAMGLVRIIKITKHSKPLLSRIQAENIQDNFQLIFLIENGELLMD